MKDDAETTSPSAATLHAALLDYYSAPGKYQLTLRQPATLFASIREILQVAAGRGTPAGADAARLRDAAMFFIRAALLYPGADHYAVMGYPAGADPSDLKERYRLLMRLTHPDFAEAGAAAWPPDAAVRVNRANEVLSSPVLRREYEEQLAALRQQRPAVSGKPASHMPAVIPRRPHAPRLQVGKRAAWILGVTLAGIAMLMLMPRQEPQHLVQRKPPAPVIPREILATPSAPPPVQAPPAAPAPAPEQPSALALLEADRLRPPVPPAAPPQVTAPPPKPAAAAAKAPVAAPAVPAAPAGSTTPVLAPQRPQEVARPAAAPVSLPAVREPTPPAPAPAAAPVISAVAVAPAASTPASLAPASTPASTPASSLTSTVAIARAATPIAAPPPPSPTLGDAQPLLTQVLQMLETGSGDQLLRLLDNDARQAPGAQALSRNYEMMIKGARPVRLTQVEFKGEPREGVLLVTGRIRVHAGETTIGSQGQRFLLRAEFASRGGKVMLMNLSGAPD